MNSFHSPDVSDTSSVSFREAQPARAELRRQQIKLLEDGITELSAHIHAATFRLLELIREYDECKGWAGPGLVSSATAPALPYLLHPCSRVRTG